MNCMFAREKLGDEAGSSNNLLSFQVKIFST